MEPTLTDELRADNQEIAGWLIYYQERGQKVMDERDCILFRTQQPGSDRVSSSAISDPTESRAEELVQKTAKDMMWLQTVEDVQRILGPKKSLLLRLRQDEARQPITGDKRGRPGWVIWVQQQWPDKYGAISGCPSDVCWISDGVLKNMWLEIIFLTARVAGKRGLLTSAKD